MNKDFPYFEFIRIARECRNILIEDILNSNSASLYDALYSDSKNHIHQIKLKLYETIENNDFSLSKKKELVSMFAKWYKDFIKNWNYIEFDVTIFQERINILKNLICVNNEWERNLKRMNVSFEKNKKILNKKIEELKMKGY